MKYDLRTANENVEPRLRELDFLSQWMYIVPVVIFVMLSSQQPEQQGGEGASN